MKIKLSYQLIILLFFLNSAALACNFEQSIPIQSVEMSGRQTLQAAGTIAAATLYVSSPWVYLTIFLEEAPPAGSEAWYAMEVDLDMDGRGNVLIAAQLPSDNTWTTDGVRVFKDTNFDVGGARAMQNDSPPQTSNGYETMVFDQGIGDDPDAAWARIAPSHPDRVQLGFKYSLLGSDDEFLWGAWTGGGVQEAGWFDYHDHFTQAEAGLPLAESSHNPLAAMDSMDNTCRWSFGFQPAEPLPDLCSLGNTPAPAPTLTYTPEPAVPNPISDGRISGTVYEDTDISGSFSASEMGIHGIPVYLYQAFCGSSMYERTTTALDGSYRFSNVSSGEYCVEIFIEDLPPASGHWIPTNPVSLTHLLYVSASQRIINNLNFGFTDVVELL